MWHLTLAKTKVKKKKKNKKKQPFCPKVQLPPMNHCKLSALSHPLTHGIMGYWGCWCHRCECVRTVHGAGASRGSVVCPPLPCLPHPSRPLLLQYPSSHSHGGANGLFKAPMNHRASEQRPPTLHPSDTLLIRHPSQVSLLLLFWAPN